MGHQQATSKRPDDGLQITGIAMRTDTPILPATGPVRAAALVADGRAALRNSYRRYGVALAGIGCSVLGDMTAIPKHDMYVLGVSEAVGVEAQHAWRLVRRAVQGHPDKSFIRDVEADARQALASAVAAYNFLEELESQRELADQAHSHAHRAAALVGHVFGCRLKFEDAGHWVVCPLHLMHIRFGLSVGIRTVRLCSICRQAIDECPHLADELYDVLITRLEDGTCSVCGRKSCTHVLGDTVTTYPRLIHSDVKLDEISVVSTPRDPLARTTAIRIRETDPVDVNGVTFDDATGRNCTYCTGPCGGFTYPFS